MPTFYLNNKTSYTNILVYEVFYFEVFEGGIILVLFNASVAFYLLNWSVQTKLAPAGVPRFF